MNFILYKHREKDVMHKKRNTKLNILTHLYKQRRNKASKLVHKARCQFYIERIDLSTSSEKLQQIVDTLSNRYSNKFCKTFTQMQSYPVFIRHIDVKVENLWANIASEAVTSTSTLVTGITTSTFFILKSVTINR